MLKLQLKDDITNTTHYELDAREVGGLVSVQSTIIIQNIDDIINEQQKRLNTLFTKDSHRS